MSRSGYSDDCDGWELIRWRGAVASAIKGRRGQAFLRELLAALDALPEKKLIRDDLKTTDGAVCALGSVAVARGIDVSGIDPSNRPVVASTFGIAEAMAAEIMDWNDGNYRIETDEARFSRVRQWVVENLKQQATP